MWNHISIITYLIYFVASAEVGKECVPNADITDGICTIITQCDLAVQAIKVNDSHEFLRCGFRGHLEVVCCPRPSNKFGPPNNVPVISQTNKRISDIECQKLINTSVPPVNQYIIGGDVASLGEFPHMVALGFKRGNEYGFDCGGSLLSNNFVLTAAHCVDTLDRVVPSIARVGVVELGSKQWKEDSDYRVAEIIKHPDYTRREKYHDLALIKLERSVHFSSSVGAVCLYTSSEDPTSPLSITGWGTTSTTKDARSEVLMKANVTVVGREECARAYTNWRKLPQGLTDTQLCAGDPEGLRDTCQGDSGGPLQGLTARDGQYRVVGITSFGRGCGTPVPGVYTRLYPYLDWIEGVVWGRQSS